MNTERIINAIAVVIEHQRYVADEVREEKPDRATIADFIRQSDEQEKVARDEAKTLAQAVAIALDMKPEAWLHRFYRHLAAVAAPTRLVQACEADALKTLQEDIRDLLVLADSLAVASTGAPKTRTPSEVRDHADAMDEDHEQATVDSVKREGTKRKQFLVWAAWLANEDMKTVVKQTGVSRTRAYEYVRELKRIQTDDEDRYFRIVTKLKPKGPGRVAHLD